MDAKRTVENKKVPRFSSEAAQLRRSATVITIKEAI
jgi:hypothetical protein